MNTIVMRTERLSIGYSLWRDTAYSAVGQRVIAADLHIELRAGEVVCLLGPNGAGKSTLLRTLAGMQPPLGGRVLLEETDIAKLPARDLARRLSVVLTERIEVGQLSVYALVALGRHPYTDWLGRLSLHDEAVARWALEVVGATALAQRQIHELSDGERQRVLIARALAQEPLVLILDEPTAFLDLPRRVEMMHLLQRLARETGRALLLSTHDLDLALRSADILWLMSSAGVLYTGAPEDLVLSGAFEETFAGDGIVFDRRNGVFQLQELDRGRVALVGEGLTARWTARAIERAGFRIVDAEEAAPMHVTVCNDFLVSRWRVVLNGSIPHTVTSLRELTALLRQHNPESPIVKTVEYV